VKALTGAGSAGKYILDTREHPAYIFLMKTPRTLQEAIIYFSDADRCFEYAKQLRFADGKIICPRCNSDRNYFIKTRRLWLCRGCNRQFTLKVNTIFEDSPLGLDKWMTAFWMLVNCKNGVSSMEIHRTLGITQKSAWFMLQRLRTALHNRSFGQTTKLGGPNSEVEVDETFVGGKVANMHKSRRQKFVENEGFKGASTGKTIVHGILDRNLRQVRAQIVPNVTRETLQNVLLKNIKYGSRVYTDDAVAYTREMNWRFVHEFVNKTQSYVKGRVHVNGMENFWALLKRGLKGTYVAVEPFHLFRYVDEQVFRYNNRATKDNPLNDADRFAAAMSQVAGRRLTYSELTGKDESPRHETTRTGEAVQEPF
jgi:transposase-like protein